MNQNADLWERYFSERSSRIKSSIIREILKITEKPDVISFAGGLPSPEMFPIREFEEAARYLIPKEGKKMLQYSATEGFPPLKKFLSEYMQKYGVPAEPENILLTNGSQQALDLIGRLFINEGDGVIVSGPTYLGALQAWDIYNPKYLSVDMDDDGMIVEQIEGYLKRGKVKFIYVLPNFHNPAGVTLPLERRKMIVELAEKYDCFIVEDDPYGELRFEGEDIPPLITMLKERVIYLSTFSKTLAPGLRLGWITAPEYVIKKFVQLKQGADLHTGTIVQYLAWDLCERGIFRAHVKKIREVYKRRRDLMLENMEKYFPEGIKWTKPQGGLFLWVILPEHIDTYQLLEKAVELKVAYVPGSPFYPDGRGKNTMRLNFSNATEENIVEGIKRLGELFKSVI
uniref:PLP-dependent aminotransferase family protein n=1 Tax=candidate division WOR-3 bacterium TaxID=2052148 RepID=A0A7C4U9J0_UNCW3